MTVVVVMNDDVDDDDDGVAGQAWHGTHVQVVGVGDVAMGRRARWSEGRQATIRAPGPGLAGGGGGRVDDAMNEPIAPITRSVIRFRRV